jgi:antitoxin component of MazEF toxin-antitoxin module
MERIVRKLGNSVGLTLPPAMNFFIGQPFLMERAASKAIVLRPNPKMHARANNSVNSSPR